MDKYCLDEYHSNIKCGRDEEFYKAKSCGDRVDMSMSYVANKYLTWIAEDKGEVYFKNHDKIIEELMDVLSLDDDKNIDDQDQIKIDEYIAHFYMTVVKQRQNWLKEQRLADIFRMDKEAMQPF